jgi:hypothetical protein
MWAASFWPSSFWTRSFWPGGAGGTVEPPPTSPPTESGGGVIRPRVMRRRDGFVEREIATPAGPLIVVVPDDWTAEDLMTLTTALVLADALN